MLLNTPKFKVFASPEKIKVMHMIPKLHINDSTLNASSHEFKLLKQISKHDQPSRNLELNPILPCKSESSFVLS